jgi:hypothetical protein
VVGINGVSMAFSSVSHVMSKENLAFMNLYQHFLQVIARRAMEAGSKQQLEASVGKESCVTRR